MSENQYRFETLQLHAGQEQPDPATGARVTPIYQTASFVFKDAKQAADRFALRDAGNIYGRLTNSTNAALEARAAALEGGTAAISLVLRGAIYRPNIKQKRRIISTTTIWSAEIIRRYFNAH